MSYEKDLNMVMTAISMATTFNMSQSEEEELMGRIKDVYAKAKAWDEFKKHNEEYGKSYYEITRSHIAKEMDIILRKYESEAD